jgi:ketosteroid isomerase-like protein
MMSLLSVLLFAILSIVAMAQTQMPDDMDDEKKISELYVAMYRAMIDKDTDALSDIFGDDFVLVHMTGIRQSKNDYIRSIENGTLNYYSCEDATLDITITQESATMIGRSYVKAAVFGGGRHCWSLQLAITLRKQHNKWVMTQAIASTF